MAASEGALPTRSRHWRWPPSSCSLRSVAVVDWRDSWKKASSAAPALDASEGATSGGDCPSLRRLGSSWSGAETGLMGVAACRCLGKMGGWPAGGMPRTWKLCPTKVPPRSGPQSPPRPERRGQKGWAGATLKSAPPPARPSSIRSPARESLTHSAIHNAPWAMHHHPPRLDDVLHSRARSRLGQMPSPIPRVSPPCHSMQTGGLQMMAYTNGSRRTQTGVGWTPRQTISWHGNRARRWDEPRDGEVFKMAFKDALISSDDSHDQPSGTSGPNPTTQWRRRRRPCRPLAPWGAPWSSSIPSRPHGPYPLDAMRESTGKPTTASSWPTTPSMPAS